MHLQEIKQHIENSAHHLVLSVHKEEDNVKETGVVIKKYIHTGTITPEEEHLLKLQIADTLKIVGIVVPFVLIPGASIIMPIIIKVAQKYHVNLMPSVL